MRNLFWCGVLLLLAAAFPLRAEMDAAEGERLRALGDQYERGRGVVRDVPTAYRYFCRAALLGDAVAAYRLGWMYFSGRAPAKRPEAAAGWLHRAADAGEPHAKNMLTFYEGVRAAADPDCTPEAATQVIPAKVYRPRPMRPGQSRIASWVEQIAPRYAVDPELVMAVIEAESGFNPSALSGKNAQGLMQLIPATALRFGVNEPWNPQENIRGGTAYLRWLLRHFGGNVALALAAYNAGEGAVEQYRGIPPYPETQAYVRRILARYQKSLHPIPPARTL